MLGYWRTDRCKLLTKYLNCHLNQDCPSQEVPLGHLYYLSVYAVAPGIRSCSPHHSPIATAGAFSTLYLLQLLLSPLNTGAGAAWHGYHCQKAHGDLEHWQDAVRWAWEDGRRDARGAAQPTRHWLSDRGCAMQWPVQHAVLGGGEWLFWLLTFDILRSHEWMKIYCSTKGQRFIQNDWCHAAGWSEMAGLCWPMHKWSKKLWLTDKKPFRVW